MPLYSFAVWHACGEEPQMEFYAYNTFSMQYLSGISFSCFHNVTVGQEGGKLPTIGNNGNGKLRSFHIGWRGDRQNVVVVLPGASWYTM